MGRHGLAWIAKHKLDLCGFECIGTGWPRFEWDGMDGMSSNEWASIWMDSLGFCFDFNGLLGDSLGSIGMN